MTSERARTRRERTFVGAECAVCEEPLEHTLRGERILQFSCTHVSHEACFYEYIKEIESQYCPRCDAPLHLDTSRGGNVLDIGKSPTVVWLWSRNELQPSLGWRVWGRIAATQMALVAFRANQIPSPPWVLSLQKKSPTL